MSADARRCERFAPGHIVEAEARRDLGAGQVGADEAGGFLRTGLQPGRYDERLQRGIGKIGVGKIGAHDPGAVELLAAESLAPNSLAPTSLVPRKMGEPIDPPPRNRRR